MRRLLLFALALAAVACHETVAPPAPPPPPAPVIAPETIVTKLYKSESPFFQTTNRALVDAYFEPTLAELIWKDAVTSKGEVGAIEFDPLYNAQDTEIKNLVIHPAKMDGEKASVLVTFDNYGKPEQITYSMTKTPAGWRIADVIYGGEMTLRGVLKGT